MNTTEIHEHSAFNNFTCHNTNITETPMQSSSKNKHEEHHHRRLVIFSLVTSIVTVTPAVPPRRAKGNPRRTLTCYSHIPL